ncbi:MAG: hypothetical protein KDI72_13880, partial [Xanthomonadales bacterium]|nr:hypothetical protein [Xanthomonadales bacterium]
TPLVDGRPTAPIERSETPRPVGAAPAHDPERSASATDASASRPKRPYWIAAAALVVFVAAAALWPRHDPVSPKSVAPATALAGLDRIAIAPLR